MRCAQFSETQVFGIFIKNCGTLTALCSDVIFLLKIAAPEGDKYSGSGV
jgi:hypothetical protein